MWDSKDSSRISEPPTNPWAPRRTMSIKVNKWRRLEILILQIKPITVRASILAMDIDSELQEAMDVARAIAASQGGTSLMQETAAGEAKASIQVKRMKVGDELPAGTSSNSNVTSSSSNAPDDGGNSGDIYGARAENA